MQIHFSQGADEDFETLYSLDEEVASHLDILLEEIEYNPSLLFKLCTIKKIADYIEDFDEYFNATPIFEFWNNKINLLRLRFYANKMLKIYRIIYAARFDAIEENQDIYILAIVEKPGNTNFNYQKDHEIMQRVLNEYAKIKPEIK